MYYFRLHLLQERDPLEGPVPHLESRLCALLSITPLAIARVLEDEPSCSSLPGCKASTYMKCGYGHGMDGDCETGTDILPSGPWTLYYPIMPSQFGC